MTLVDFYNLTYPQKLLVADILSQSRSKKITSSDLVLKEFNLSNQEQRTIKFKLAKLARGYPLDYLLSHINFLHLKITVKPGVFIPRPETEAWLNQVRAEILQKFSSKNPLLVDLCAGTGVIGLSLSDLFEKVLLVDISKRAITNIEHNIAQNKIANCMAIRANLFANPVLTQSIKDSLSWVLVCNPPYVPLIDRLYKQQNNLEFEPYRAIFSRDNGLGLFKKIYNYLKKLPLPKMVIFELDPRNIHTAKKILHKYFKQIEIWQDFNQFDRVLIARN